jgi:hypothetical protein
LIPRAIVSTEADFLKLNLNGEVMLSMDNKPGEKQ